MNPWYSKIFETSHWHLMLDGTSLLLYLSVYADAFFVLPFDLCIIVLKNESFSFLILRHLGPTVLSNFFRALIHSRISHGKPQRILEYEETYIRVYIYICVYIYTYRRDEMRFQYRANFSVCLRLHRFLDLGLPPSC